MPIRIDTDLPARAILEEENVFVMDIDRAVTQDIRPLRIAILNLMPNKLDTELHLLRSLSNTPLQIDITFLKTASYEPTHVPESHMEKFYVYFDEVRDKKFDGMIITGAPVELKEFEEVDYWEEVAEIMEWTKKNVTSTLHICWAAQAGLYYHYGVKKNVLDQKISGVYRHYPLHKKTLLLSEYAVFEQKKVQVPDTERLNAVCSYMKEHYSENVSLEQLCKIAGVSRYSLIRYFTKYKKITPYQYLESIRVNRAKLYLEQGTEPAEAAAMTGFSDQSHFTNFFKRLFGLTPAQYQRIFTDKKGY